MSYFNNNRTSNYYFSSSRVLLCSLYSFASDPLFLKSYVISDIPNQKRVWGIKERCWCEIVCCKTPPTFVKCCKCSNNWQRQLDKKKSDQKQQWIIWFLLKENQIQMLKRRKSEEKKKIRSYGSSIRNFISGWLCLNKV